MKNFLSKIDFKLLAIIGLVIVIYFQTCSKGGECNAPKVHSDTVTTRDTVFIPGTVTTIPTYIPVPVGKGKPTKEIPPASDDYQEVVNQYNDIADSFYSYTYYRDSIKLKDSLYPGKDLGYVEIYDQISENHINHRDIKYQLKFPEIKEKTTITNTIEAKKKNQLYIGGGLMGNQQTPIQGLEADLMLKSKNDHLYGISAGFQKPDGTKVVTPYFGVRMFWKIGKK
jgi:hypothetical protein